MAEMSGLDDDLDDERMSDNEQGKLERRDEWALADLDAAIGIVGATVGTAFGPLGSILAAFVGPYAKLAVARVMRLRTRVSEEIDLDDEELRLRLEESEPLAQMMAEVVRGTVESDLEAKRRLLARAAIRALKDDAVVDEESVFVRTANAVDTTDVRVLALIGERGEGWVSNEDIARASPGLARVAGASSARLLAAGLLVRPSEAGLRPPSGHRLSRLGRDFLDRLLQAGLEGELRQRVEGRAP